MAILAKKKNNHQDLLNYFLQRIETDTLLRKRLINLMLLNEYKRRLLIDRCITEFKLIHADPATIDAFHLLKDKQCFDIVVQALQQKSD